MPISRAGLSGVSTTGSSWSVSDCEPTVSNDPRAPGDGATTPKAPGPIAANLTPRSAANSGSIADLGPRSISAVVKTKSSPAGSVAGSSGGAGAGRKLGGGQFGDFGDSLMSSPVSESQPLPGAAGARVHANNMKSNNLRAGVAPVSDESVADRTLFTNEAKIERVRHMRSYFEAHYSSILSADDA